MKRFFRKAFAHLPASKRGSPRGDGHFATNAPRTASSKRSSRSFQRNSLVLLLLLCCAIGLGLTATLATAQSSSPKSPATETLRENNSQETKQRARPEFALPKPAAKAPEVEAPPAGDPYVLEFNRSPVVGTRFSLRGIYDESRLGFTKPQDWQIKSVKALIRYRHSPALYATRSNLTVLINGASVGSIPLNRKEGEIGSAAFNIPLSSLQNYNQLTIAALQNNSPTCTQDPYDPSLWTEILPDSKIVFDFLPQPVSLDFNRFPYPIFDELSLYPNQLAYLLPAKADDTWLTSATRFQAALGRLADFRRLDTRVVEDVDDVKQGERLVVIGTPTQQPALEALDLPLSIQNNAVVDGNQKVLPPDVGVLMLTTTPNSEAPILVATGNGSAGVAKAVQFLVQSRDRKIGTGQIIIVKDLSNVSPPPARDWSGYLPPTDTFQLKDLNNDNNEPFKDITVRGSDSPPIEIDFRALPDDRFLAGNVMTLNYSYGPQINAKTSLVEVKLDGVALVGKRLTSINGGTRESLKVPLPENLITPTSKIQVDFRLDARERRSCSRVTDQQLWGTLHADTSFELNRTSGAQLPDLKLLQYGFPLTAPQDLSNTAIVVPKEPSPSEVATLLEFGSRMGRLSKAESVQLSVYTAGSLPEEQREKRHLVGIGTSSRFPFPEALESGDFALREVLERQLQQSTVQTSPDNDGVIKQIISPWNKGRVLLMLSSQTNNGLNQVQDFLRQDPLFFQLREDTILISANAQSPNLNDPNAYNLQFLQREAKRQLSDAPAPRRFVRFLAGSWFLLAPATVVATLVLYGVIQVYLKRAAGQEK